MPADLDLSRLFDTVGSYADRIPLGTAQDARQRARRRRQRLATICAAIALLLAAGTAGAIEVNRPPAPPAQQPSPRPTVSFVPVRPAGSLAMEQAHGDASRYAEASIVDGVAYALALDGDRRLRAGALDLASGAPRFPTVDLGTWEAVFGFVASNRGLLVTGLRPGAGENTIVAATLDPRSGALRWQQSVAGEVMVVGDTMVRYEPGTMRLAALDWTTGEPLWSRVVDGSIGVRAVADAPRLPFRTGQSGIDPGDRRLVATSASAFEVIDVTSGGTLSRVALPEVVATAVVAQSVYAFAAGEVWAYPLDGSPPALVGGGDAESFSVTACGAGLVCFFSGQTFSITAFDAASHEERLQQLQTTGISVVGDRLIDGYGNLWDLAGRQLTGAGLDAANQAQAVWWLTPGSVLRLAVEYPSATQWPTVEGVSTEDGSRLDLGEIPTLSGGDGCAADLRYLVCPTTDGFHAWQFAAD